MINNFRYIIQRQMYTTLGSSYTNMPYTYAGGSSYGPNPSDLYRKTIEDYGDYYNPMTRQLEDRDMLRGGVNTQFLSRLLPFAGTAFSLIGPNKLIKPKALQNITSKISEKTNPYLMGFRDTPGGPGFKSFFQQQFPKMDPIKVSGTSLKTLPDYIGGSNFTGKSISDFYASQGKALPSVSDRAIDYTAITGKSGYTGTGPQNIEMIEGLKSGSFGSTTTSVLADKGQMLKTRLGQAGQALGDARFASTVGLAGTVGRMLFDDKNPYTYTAAEQASDVASKYGTIVGIGSKILGSAAPAALGPIGLGIALLSSFRKKKRVKEEQERIQTERRRVGEEKYAYQMRRPEREASEAEYLEYASKFNNPYGLGDTGIRTYQDGGKFKTSDFQQQFVDNISAKFPTLMGLNENENNILQEYLHFVISNENPNNKGYNVLKQEWEPYILEKNTDKGMRYEIDLGYGRMLNEFKTEQEAKDYIKNYGSVSNENVMKMFFEDFESHYKRAERKVDTYIKNKNTGGDGYGEGAFAKLPFKQRLMLTDYDYTGVLNEFPLLVQGVVNNDWNQVKTNYQRYVGKGEMKTRNTLTKEFFLTDGFSDLEGVNRLYEDPLIVTNPDNLLGVDVPNDPVLPAPYSPEAFKDGGKKESGAELTGDELIVTSDKQERIETAIKNKDVKTVSEEITKSMQEGNITPGAASHKTNPLPVAEDGIIYNDKGKPTGNTIKDGDAVYPNANVINKLTDKQIFNKTKKHIAKWKTIGMA